MVLSVMRSLRSKVKPPAVYFVLFSTDSPGPHSVGRTLRSLTRRVRLFLGTVRKNRFLQQAQVPRDNYRHVRCEHVGRYRLCVVY